MLHKTTEPIPRGPTTSRSWRMMMQKIFIIFLMSGSIYSRFLIFIIIYLTRDACKRMLDRGGKTALRDGSADAYHTVCYISFKCGGTRWVPRSRLSSLQKEFRKMIYDYLRRMCATFMPLLCALFGRGSCRKYEMFRFQGGNTLISMTKLVSQRLKEMIIFEGIHLH